MTSASRPSACPTCRKVALAAPPIAPFCSARCQAIDLGKWLAEEYRVPDQLGDESGGGVEGLPAAGEVQSDPRSRD